MAKPLAPNVIVSAPPSNNVYGGLIPIATKGTVFPAHILASKRSEDKSLAKRMRARESKPAAILFRERNDDGQMLLLNR
jgi:hypothetical protein